MGAVTWETVAALSLLFVGLAIAAASALFVFASGMASVPEPYEGEARKGCALFFVGLAIFIGAGGHLVGWWVLPILPR